MQVGALAATVLVVLGSAQWSPALAPGGGDPTTDCFTELEGVDSTSDVITCTDCDPACDKDGVAMANGSCTFTLAACLNQPNVAGCTPTQLRKAKVRPLKRGIETPADLSGNPVCGLFSDVSVRTKKKGSRSGRKKIRLVAVGQVKPRKKDKDRIKLVCEPQPGSCPSPVEVPCGDPPACDDGDADTIDLCEPEFGCYHRAANRESLFSLLGRTRCVAYAPRGFDPTQGVFPDSASLTADLTQLAGSGFRCLWTYGDDGTLDLIPRIAKQLGFTVVIMGIFDPASEERLRRAEAQREFVDAYRIGSEGLAFGRYALTRLLVARDRIRLSTKRPVTTSEPLAQILSDEELRDAFDFISANVHPYFAEITEPKAAVMWTVERYCEIGALSEHFVYLSEVGLPTCGDPRVDQASQRDYYRFLAQESVPFAFFEAYDQPWKRALPVEPCWGLFHSDGTPKQVVSFLLSRGD